MFWNRNFISFPKLRIEFKICTDEWKFCSDFSLVYRLITYSTFFFSLSLTYKRTTTYFSIVVQYKGENGRVEEGPNIVRITLFKGLW